MEYRRFSPKCLCKNGITGTEKIPRPPVLMPAADEREELLHMAKLLLNRCSEKQLHVTVALLEAMLKYEE